MRRAVQYDQNTFYVCIKCSKNKQKVKMNKNHQCSNKGYFDFAFIFL